MNGIDVYSGNGTLNFDIVNDSNQVVYIKATEGRTYADPTVRSYYQQSKAYGLKVGFYHYLRNNNPEDEVNNLLQATNGLIPDCKYAIDCEVTLGQTKQQITSNVRRFFDIMKSKGLQCVLYTYSSFLTDNLDYSQLTDIPLWIANYSTNDPHVPNEVGWQYSETGRIAGNDHNTDLDIFYEGIFIGNNSNASNSTPINVQPIIVNSGDATVRTIQTQLNTMLKCNLVIDGWMGDKTKEQIINFQRIMGLTADGIWGVNTAGAATQILNRFYDAIEASHLEYATRYIQYRTGSKIDGVFGNGTANCLTNWQRARGLVADGKCGNNTWSKLLDENC